MKWLLNILLLGLSIVAHGQNLVPNPGFDDLTDCPDQRGQIHLAFPWVSATINSPYYPDLFNICSSNDLVSPPTAGNYIDSYQQPLSGAGYAGIYVWRNDNFNINGYIESPLTKEMDKSVQYYLRFYVSPDLTASQLWRYSDAVGLTLSDTFYYQAITGNQVIPLSPVIENRGELITDTVGWTKVSGCYYANGGEKYAIIGNFRTDTETISEVEDPSVYPYFTYLYIEDVLITLFDPLPDTILLCDGIPEKLNAGFLDATYLWSTGETDSTITVSQPGLYTVAAFMDNCTLRDTVVVLDTRETENFPSDTLICRDEPLRLSPSLPGEYRWSDGSQGSEIIVASSGIYSVSVTNGCGEFVFSATVEAEDCVCNIYVPNAFSPNGDGVNDELQLFGGCDFEYRITGFGVFDRWGGQVYSVLEGEKARWDGTARGKPLPNGVYVWFLEYDVVRNGVPEHRTGKGEVVILR